MVIHVSNGVKPHGTEGNPFGFRWQTIEELETEALPMLIGIQERGDTPLLNWLFGHMDDGAHRADAPFYVDRLMREALMGLAIELARRGPVIVMVGSRGLGECVHMESDWWRNLQAEGVRLCFDAASTYTCCSAVAREMGELKSRGVMGLTGNRYPSGGTPVMAYHNPMIESVHAAQTGPEWEWQAGFEAVVVEKYLTAKNPDGTPVAQRVIDERIARINNAPNKVHFLENPNDPGVTAEDLALVAKVRPHIAEGGWA